MSAIKEHLLEQVEEVQRLVSALPHRVIVERFPDRLVIRCLNNKVSRNLTTDLHDHGYAVETQYSFSNPYVYVHALLELRVLH